MAVATTRRVRWPHVGLASQTRDHIAADRKSNPSILSTGGTALLRTTVADRLVQRIDLAGDGEFRDNQPARTISSRSSLLTSGCSRTWETGGPTGTTASRRSVPRAVCRADSLQTRTAYLDGDPRLLQDEFKPAPRTSGRSAGTLQATADMRMVVADNRARYFVANLNDRSLTPSTEPRPGTIDFADWLGQEAWRN